MDLFRRNETVRPTTHFDIDRPIHKWPRAPAQKGFAEKCTILKIQRGGGTLFFFKKKKVGRRNALSKKGSVTHDSFMSLN
jgi:hypothetical protein